MISIFSDGSSHSQSGLPGGWAFVVVRDGVPIMAKSGGDPCTSNNIMELTGMVEGMKWLFLLTPEERYRVCGPGETVELVSDSQYSLGMASGGYTPTKNLELAGLARKLAITLEIERFRWVKGHRGDEFNERCDGLAKDAKHLLMPEKMIKKRNKRKAAKERNRGIVKRAATPISSES